MDQALDAISEINATGYDTHDVYFATRFGQGGHPIYSFDLSVEQLVGILPKPDPETRQPGNRLINIAHARGFGDYVIERDDWVCPPLLLRASEDEFKFESLRQVQGADFGQLKVPRAARSAIKILDGQHRILGFHLGWEKLNNEIQKSREALAAAKRSSEDEVTNHHQRRLERFLATRDRLSRDRVALAVMIVDDPAVYQQVFVDIADNAKGVTRALASRFDTRKVVNRALADVMKHPLLDGRVEEERDRLNSANQHILSAKHVADITRSVQVGVAGRISKTQEKDLHEHAVAAAACEFLDAMESFPQLLDIREGRISPSELRETSLLGSATMWRVLAGAYFELRAPRAGNGSKARMSKTGIQSFFTKLAPWMNAPVEADSPWMNTDCFVEHGMAPTARQGDMKRLTNHLVDWAENEPDFLGQ